MTSVRRTASVAGVPMLWAEPPVAQPWRLALWVHAFGGTKEAVWPQLDDLARRGFMAVSWDVIEHGERSLEPVDAFKSRVRSNLRQYFWPIMDRAIEEASLIIDWAKGRCSIAAGVAIGGISMGGDVAVAAAGHDQRIDCVAAALATPDWLRPGSSEAQGVPDAAGWKLYHRHNPLTNLSRYAHWPAILFACGEHDRQVPPDGADRFLGALSDLYADCPERLAILLEAGGAHRFSSAMWSHIARWFEAPTFDRQTPSDVGTKSPANNIRI